MRGRNLLAIMAAASFFDDVKQRQASNYRPGINGNSRAHILRFADGSRAVRNDAMHPAQLNEIAARRRRARQTHPGKRGRR